MSDPIADRTARLSDAISGERADWFRVEVDPRDIAATLRTIEAYEAVAEAARKYQCFGSCDEADCPDAVLNNALAALDIAKEAGR